MPCLPSAHLHFGTEGATASPHKPRLRSTGSAAQRTDGWTLSLKAKDKRTAMLGHACLCGVLCSGRSGNWA